MLTTTHHVVLWEINTEKSLSEVAYDSSRSPGEAD